MSAFRGFGSFVVLCILLFGRVLLAQNATLNGTVLDNAGAAVPGAHIKVVNTGTNATQAGDSNDQGVYSIVQLAPGSYTVTSKGQDFVKQWRLA
jgi:protocatechuate 3,4-dioxygenase beta subunit